MTISFRWFPATVALAAAACGTSPLDPETSSTEEAATVACTRDVVALRTKPGACAVDVDCPCGSHCDTVEHSCVFSCMIPPASPTEGCPTGQTCDDTGRCTAPNVPPAVSPTLTTAPLALYPTPGGTAQSAQVRLAVASSASVAAAQTTVLRVIGKDGIDVSCNASTFGHECTLTGWSFSFDGKGYTASKPVYVRAPASTPAGQGLLQLHVDATNTDLIIPAGATAGADGSYTGFATSPSSSTGIAITAQLRGSMLIVRDKARIIAPDGALALDVATAASQPTTARRTVWLRAPGAADTAGAIAGDYQAGISTFGATPGGLTTPLTLSLPGGTTQTWSLQLTKTAAATAECKLDTECGAGNVCPSALGVCVPSAVWTPPTVAAANLLDDPSSSAWWAAISPLLGTGDTGTSAFSTTGADLIESLMCTTATTDPGRSGIGWLGATEMTHSGDLACLSGDLGVGNTTPGAIGFLSQYDRTGAAVVGSAMLTTCLADLSRSPTGGFANFAATVGTCVNPARLFPALRLLATGELDKRTRAEADPRRRGLFTRLVQQWLQLQSFVASTGLSEREYDDAIASSPDEARDHMLALLDTLDAGWSALLDQRIAGVLPTALSWSMTATNDASDYRAAKQPVVYWPFNGTANDVMYNVALTPQVATTPSCSILPSRNSIMQGYYCPGFSAFLPAQAPGIGDGGNLSVMFAIDDFDSEIPTYVGGTIVATETLAIVRYPGGEISVVHPTDDGGTEWVSLGGIGDIGQWTNPSNGYGATPLAVVRDTASMTYTLYSMDAGKALHIVTRPYHHAIGGRLIGMSPRQILVGNGPRITVGHEQWPALRSYAGFIDDVAIFKSAIGSTEFQRYGLRRAENNAMVWPTRLTLVDDPAQELTTPLGAAMLEAQVAELGVVETLVTHLAYQAEQVCEGVTPRGNFDATVARIGRTLRQAAVIEGLAAGDTSARATVARQQLVAKRGAIATRVRTLSECVNPYGLADRDVPLYFDNVDPAANEKAAYFAASDHMLVLADQHVGAASQALFAVQQQWTAAHNSQIQQQEQNQLRTDRLNELDQRYGGDLIKLCGITGETSKDVLGDVMAGRLSVDTCFVVPTPACTTANAATALRDADPTCYRGQIGEALMEMRSAYYQQTAAYATWQAAIGNSQGATRKCVLMDIDAHGCTAADRKGLTGITCPPGFEGTIAMTDQFLKEIHSEQLESQLLSITMSIASGFVDLVTGDLVGAGKTIIGLVTGSLGSSAEERIQQHQALLQIIGTQEALTACWTEAETYQRAIASAEDTYKAAVEKLNAATLALQNTIAAARQDVLEGPAQRQREMTQPVIPIEFNYWLPAAINSYRFAMDSAKRYAYVALRAVEYDAQATFSTAQPGVPQRSAVLGAWRPDALVQQLTLMHAQTDTRQTSKGPPALEHVTFDFGTKFFGVAGTDPRFGATLASYARRVYSTKGEYLGLGVAFSFMPAKTAEAPAWRCGERIWRVNIGASGVPTSGTIGMPHVKLIKRNLFASRSCSDANMVVAGRQPSQNVLVAAGDPEVYVDPKTSTTADIPIVNFDLPDAFTTFQDAAADALGVPSSELALQGMYGDYVLLFPDAEFTGPRALSALKTTIQQLDLRFDFLSVDATPSTSRVAPLNTLP